jgi:hypothetical protein
MVLEVAHLWTGEMKEVQQQLVLWVMVMVMLVLVAMVMVGLCPSLRGIPWEAWAAALKRDSCRPSWTLTQ